MCLIYVYMTGSMTRIPYFSWIPINPIGVGKRKKALKNQKAKLQIFCQILIKLHFISRNKSPPPPKK